MKVSELREMNADDVKNKLEELHEESFNLRLQHVSGQLTSPIRLRQVRRDIAKVHTVLKEHVLGVRALAGGE
ncbi:MAG TPA: 50S ribosomal protein L29 [Candidatus Latescibacteria bacterium]|nr:50S ribosomal protein L29 [Candidatus Latescibacterota bacterium]